MSDMFNLNLAAFGGAECSNLLWVVVWALVVRAERSLSPTRCHLNPRAVEFRCRVPREHSLRVVRVARSKTLHIVDHNRHQVVQRSPVHAITSSST